MNTGYNDNTDKLDMKYELSWRKQKCEEEGMTIPQPVYLYIRKYGRDAYTDIEEFAALYGDRQWIEFNTISINEKNLLTTFKTELEKNRKLGKEFEGFVSVKLDDSIEEKDLRTFFSYLQSRSGFHFIFTADSCQDVEYLKNILEQYFYIRIKSGQCYSVEEQWDIICKSLTEAGITTTTDDMECMLKKLEDHEWNEDTQVNQRLTCIVKNCIFNCCLLKKEITIDDLIKEFDKLSCQKERHSIGFY